MKTTFGLVIFIAGLMMTVYTGFNYVTKEGLVDFGNFELTKESDHKVYWEPYIGIGIMVIGGIMLTPGRTKSLAHS